MDSRYQNNTLFGGVYTVYLLGDHLYWRVSFLGQRGPFQLEKGCI